MCVLYREVYVSVCVSVCICFCVYERAYACVLIISLRGSQLLCSVVCSLMYPCNGVMKVHDEIMLTALSSLQRTTTWIIYFFKWVKLILMPNYFWPWQPGSSLASECVCVIGCVSVCGCVCICMFVGVGVYLCRSPALLSSSSVTRPFNTSRNENIHLNLDTGRTICVRFCLNTFAAFVYRTQK